MPHPVFECHVQQIEPLRAERLLDAAAAATAMHRKKDWWDDLLARARGVVREVVERAGPLFTFNGRAVNTSDGLRREFGQHVSGGRVDR